MPEDMSGKKIEIPIKGPVFITTVYPVIQVEQDKLPETIESIEGALDLSGKELLESVIEKHYFPAPFSYPYNFSDQDLEKLRERIRSIDTVDATSLAEEVFPNITQYGRQHFESTELESILKSERYLGFKLKHWENVRFMRFPTFLVVTIDSGTEKIASFEDYRKFAKYWKTTISEFNGFSELKEALGISRRNRRWLRTPILTFICLQAYMTAEFQNRYMFTRAGKDESQERFLREVSLRGLQTQASMDQPTVRTFEFITHESNNFDIYRFYYSSIPLPFDDSVHIPDVRKRGTYKTLSMILRNVLFTYVVLPAAIARLKSADGKLNRLVSNVWEDRVRMFDKFSRREVNSFRSGLISSLSMHEEILDEINRTQEITKATDRLFRFFEDPFQIPLADPSVRFTTKQYESYLDAYRKLFHFDEARFNTTNDRKVVSNYSEQLREVLNSVENKAVRLKEELRNATQLAEARINMIENRNNVLLAIILPALGAIFVGLFYYWFWQ